MSRALLKGCRPFTDVVVTNLRSPEDRNSYEQHTSAIFPSIYDRLKTIADILQSRE